MIPLRLSWAWTIHKAQGQSIRGKIVIHLGDKEMELGLSYVAFSRATRFSDIGIDGGITYERLTTKISGHAKMKDRLAEETRLDKLAEETVAKLKEFYGQGDGGLN